MSMHDKKLYGTATVGSKGQVVIPAEAREILGIETGDRLYVVGSKQGKWVGLIQEEQLRSIMEQLADNIELYKDVLDTNKQ
jgi:AbrB family looped-hinge helix DNA binding protein